MVWSKASRATSSWPVRAGREGMAQVQERVRPPAPRSQPAYAPQADRGGPPDRPFTTDWSWVPFAAITLIALILRLIDLGARAMHHDESLHALYSWYLYVGRGYTHDPMMHGPFLFHSTA